MTSAEPVSEAEIEGLKKKRDAAEKRVQQLNNALQNLQELFRNCLRAAKEYTETDTVTAGVVVVFDSPDGGQASATLASLV